MKKKLAYAIIKKVTLILITFLYLTSDAQEIIIENKASTNLLYSGILNKLILHIPCNDSTQYEIKTKIGTIIKLEDKNSYLYKTNHTGTEELYIVKQVRRQDEISYIDTISRIYYIVDSLYTMTVYPAFNYKNDSACLTEINRASYLKINNPIFSAASIASYSVLQYREDSLISDFKIYGVSFTQALEKMDLRVGDILFFENIKIKVDSFVLNNKIKRIKIIVYNCS
jgi:hypothetical protein